MAEFPCNGKTREILATLRSLYIEERAVKMAEYPCNGKTSRILATLRSLYIEQREESKWLNFHVMEKPGRFWPPI